MKKVKKTHPTQEMPSPIDSLTYACLTDEEKAQYHPVNPKHERLPRVCFVLYMVALACVGLYIGFMVSPSFAEFFNRHIASIFRWILATLTAWLPFSLGEFIIWMLPFALVAVLVYAFRYRCHTWRSALVFVGSILSVVATLFSVFTLNFASGYRGVSLDEKLGLEKSSVSADDLYTTATYLKDLINEETQNIVYGQDGFSQMPYSLSVMREHLDEAYEVFCQNHDFISHSPGAVKPVYSARECLICTSQAFTPFSQGKQT